MILRPAGPQGPWQEVRAAVADAEWVIVHGTVGRWAPDPAAAHRPDCPPGWLSAEEADRYTRMRHPAARLRFAASRLLLRCAVGAVLGVEPQRVELARAPGGRPYVRGGGPLDVSLSHTGDVTALALSVRCRVGVDVERLGRTVHGTGLEHRICIPLELEALSRVPPAERNAALVRLWTLKEAYAKAVGAGLRLSFSRFGFSPDGPETILLDSRGRPAAAKEWRFTSHLLGGGHAVSVAARRGAGSGVS